MNNLKPGYWNGEPAQFKAVLYRVLEPETKTWWTISHVGEIRQAIQINYGGETWIIDNQHGDGYYKVTAGQGSPRCGHKSITDYEILGDVPEENWQIQYDHEAIKKENEAHDQWMARNHPEDHKKLMALREGLKEHQRNTIYKP
jgi:hypothetical protein